MTLYCLAVRALLAGLLTFCFVPFCAAQRSQAGSRLKQLPLDIQVPYSQRTDAFRRLLFEFGFQPRHSFDELQTNPDESLLLVLGEPGFLSQGLFPQGLRTFVEQGGAVLIATDKETEGEAGQLLSELAGVRVTGETFVSTALDKIYSVSPYCLFVQQAPASTAVLDAPATIMEVDGPPDLFRNPRPDQPALRVATNAPSRLKTSGPSLAGFGIHRLAYLPRFSVDETKVVAWHLGWPLLPEEKMEPREKPLFAVGGTVGKGRVLVLADHSIFINRMILPRDNGNLEFTANCLHWLRGGVSTPAEAVRAMNRSQTPVKLIGQRDKVLLWDDGVIRTDFEVPLKTMPMTLPLKPSLDMAPAVVAALDQTVARLEDEDVFNRTLGERIEDMPGGWPRVVRNAMYALTLALFLFLSYLFLWRGRHHHESAVPLLAHAVNRHEPRASLLELRRRELLRSGNVWETAHQLVRQYFESAGIPLTGDSPPRVVIRGSWWQCWQVSRRLARLWDLACGNAPARIPPAALNRWLRDLEELKTDLVNGTIAVGSRQ